MKRLKWTNQEKLAIALLGTVGSACFRVVSKSESFFTGWFIIVLLAG